MGTTSACAENTSGRFGYLIDTRNYLRVRGEYPYRYRGSPYIGELPPRARRIRYEDQERLRYIGTTSACAENTANCGRNYRTRRNYLRVRGEYSK